MAKKQQVKVEVSKKQKRSRAAAKKKESKSDDKEKFIDWKKRLVEHEVDIRFQNAEYIRALSEHFHKYFGDN